MIKTYQVRGLLEWKALIPAGKANIRVVFKGGQMATMGMLPAEFATANIALQKIIESSDYFREHRITVFPPEPEGKNARKVRPKAAGTVCERPSGAKPDSVKPAIIDEDEGKSGEPDPGDDGQDGCSPEQYNQC